MAFVVCARKPTGGPEPWVRTWRFFALTELTAYTSGRSARALEPTADGPRAPRPDLRTRGRPLHDSPLGRPLVFALALAACGDSNATRDGADATDTASDATDATSPGETSVPLCERGYAAPVDTGALGEARLTETSGVVAARATPGVLWLHDDGSKGKRLFALAEDGTVLATLTLRGVYPIDVEDVAAAPCPDASGPCLWLADTGNNDLIREDQVVFAVPEPVIANVAAIARGDLDPVELDAEKAWTFPISVPAPDADIEALAVAPDASALWLFEKTRDRSPARIFEYDGPFDEGATAAPSEVRTFNAPGDDSDRGHAVTGADLHPSGRALALRTYAGLFEYRLAAGESPIDLATLHSTLVGWSPDGEPQGEAIGYDQAGTGLWTTSEDPDDLPGRHLHHTPCAGE